MTEKIIVSSDDSFYSWDSLGGWLEINEPNTEQSYLDYGFDVDKLPDISEKEWAELDDISVLYYTSDTEKDGVIVETIVDPFSLYDEMGKSMEVLYYTDDKNKEDVKLHVRANYSPLDEIEGEFEVLSWVDEEEDVSLSLDLIGQPKAQLVYRATPYKISGYLQGFDIEDYEEEGSVVRYLLSHNKVDWYTWSNNGFVPIDTGDETQIILKGLTKEKIQLIDRLEWESWLDDQIYIGVFLKDRDKDSSSQVDSISVRDLIPTQTTKISEAKLYILNTVATIDMELIGNTIKGDINDIDEGKVQYRIFLNGNVYHPFDGSFTDLATSPLNLNLTIPNHDLTIGESNNLKIEFQDYWGTTDYWETNFIATYNGLLFLDETGEYYSTNIGEVLQYLDFGVIIAGQTTLQHKIVLRNTYGYDVENINIRANQSNFPDGMSAQFSTIDTPFEYLDEINLTYKMENGEETEFFIRLTTDLESTSQSQGEFEIVVNADKVKTD